MAKQTIWLILAGLAALGAAPVMYVGLERNWDALAGVGLGLFVLSMSVTPVMRLVSSK